MIIYTALMALDEIPHVYWMDAAHSWTTPWYCTFTLPFITGEEEGTAKSIMAISTFIVVIFTALGISICIWKRY